MEAADNNNRKKQLRGTDVLPHTGKQQTIREANKRTDAEPQDATKSLDILPEPNRQVKNSNHLRGIFETQLSDPSISSPSRPVAHPSPAGAHIHVPDQAMSFGDICDTHLNLFGTIPRIEHTESRLPSLELILGDVSLSASIGADVQHPIIEQLVDGLKSSDETTRFQALSTIVNSLAKQNYQLPMIVKTAIVNILSMFIKERISKTVEYYRAVEDSTRPQPTGVRKVGRKPTLPYAHSLSDSGSTLAMPRTANSIVSILEATPQSNLLDTYHWAYISLSLKILRNICTEASVQNLINNEDLVVLIMNHLHMIRKVRENAQTSDIKNNAHINEVRKFLLKSILTFANNSMNDNISIKERLLNYLWPNTYDQLLPMVAEAEFDSFCQLVHAHLSDFIDGGLKFSEDETQSVTELKEDFYITSSTAHSREHTKLSTEFSNFYFKLLDRINEMIAKKLADQQSTARYGTIAGHTTSDYLVMSEWFNYFQLRLFGMNNGQRLVILLERLLCDSSVNKQIRTQRLSSMLYSLHDYSLILDDEINRIKSLSRTRKQEETLTRKWNMLKRSFINRDLLELLVKLLTQAATELAAEHDSFIKIKEYLAQHSCEQPSIHDTQTPIPLRPLLKSLINLVAAPEFDTSESLLTTDIYDLCIALLSDTVKCLIHHVEKPHDSTSLFISLSQQYSTRDVLLLLASVLNCNIPDKCIAQAHYDLTKSFQIFQSIDIGCEQAAVLATKLISTRLSKTV